MIRWNGDDVDGGDDVDDDDDHGGDEQKCLMELVWKKGIRHMFHCQGFRMHSVYGIVSWYHLHYVVL